MPQYSPSAPVNCDVDFNHVQVKGKTAIVTGGANGLGEAYIRSLVAAGAKVLVGDLDVEKGRKLEKELSNVKFVRCNTADWDDQVRLFQDAVSFSPTATISYVIANAGIHRPDEVFLYEDAAEPREPDLATLDVNLIGVLYTVKLATHYFIKQNGEQLSETQEDTCLVLIGSGAAFLDCPRAPQYCATKWAMRGIMHSLRRTAFHYGSRVNVISPWYVKTNILSSTALEHIAGVGVQFAEAKDAGECLLRILSDTEINGRSLFVSPRTWAPRGYLDLDLDDYPENTLLQEIQKEQVKSAPAEMGLFI